MKVITYICTADQAACMSTLEAAGILIRDEDDNLNLAAGMTVVDLGVLYDNTDPENPIALGGWHCNVIGTPTASQQAGLDAVEIFPLTPQYTI